MTCQSLSKHCDDAINLEIFDRLANEMKGLNQKNDKNQTTIK